jgi:hypothetical protein
MRRRAANVKVKVQHVHAYKKMEASRSNRFYLPANKSLLSVRQNAGEALVASSDLIGVMSRQVRNENRTSDIQIVRAENNKYLLTNNGKVITARYTGQKNDA